MVKPLLRRALEYFRRNPRPDLSKPKVMPKHQIKAQPGSYSITTQKGFRYEDNRKYIPKGQSFFPITSHRPHFILRDKTGQARFVIGYEHSNFGILIRNIQRVRTQYSKLDDFYYWDSDKETQASKEFQKELGVHPDEFIIYEFIHAFRDHLLSGRKIYLNYISDDYYLILKKFCSLDSKGYFIDPKRSRVKLALGIK